MRIFLVLLIYCSTILSTSISASENADTSVSILEWELAKHKHGISVYQNKQTKDHIHLKANMTTSGCINAFKAVFFDTDNAPLWLADAIKVELLASPNPNEHLVYTQINAPWPIKDRDMVTYSIMTETQNTHLLINIQAMPDKHPLQTGFERIKDVSASWQIALLDNKQVNSKQLKGEQINSEQVISEVKTHQLMIEYQVKVKPAGNIPLWLGKSVAKSNVLSTFKQLKKRLKYYSCD